MPCGRPAPGLLLAGLLSTAYGRAALPSSRFRGSVGTCDATDGACDATDGGTGGSCDAADAAGDVRDACDAADDGVGGACGACGAGGVRGGADDDGEMLVGGLRLEADAPEASSCGRPVRRGVVASGFVSVNGANFASSGGSEPVSASLPTTAECRKEHVLLCFSRLRTRIFTPH